MSVRDEAIEAAFMDEYARLKHEGLDDLLKKRFDALLFQMYRRGYIRGHSDRSREVQQENDQAIREGRVPMGVKVRYENDRLTIEGRDITPRKE
jgi:hypothetical protein